MKRVNLPFAVLAAALLLVAAVADPATAVNWELDCDSGAVFTWQAMVTDSVGDPIPSGDYELIYCYYEDSAGLILIGCCTTTATVGTPSPGSKNDKAALGGSALATLTYAQPIWEDTTKVGHFPKATGVPDVWLELTFNGEEISPMTLVTSVPNAGTAKRMVGDLHTAPGRALILEGAPASSGMVDVLGNDSVASVALYRPTDDILPMMIMEVTDTTSILAVFDTSRNTTVSVTGDGAGTFEGLVWSKTGFKFPDSTIQTTAWTGGGGCWVCPANYTYLADINDSVGIGTTTPSEKLDVDGNIHASGTITSGSSITIDGNNNQIRTTLSKLSFEDDTLMTLGQLRLGTTSSPYFNSDLYVDKVVNTASERHGVDIGLDNSGTGALTGLSSIATSTTPGAGGSAAGVRCRGISDGSSRQGVFGWAYPKTSGLTTGSSIGVYGWGWQGQSADGVHGQATEATTGYGVRGVAFDNSEGYGLYGSAHDNDSTSYGVYGRAYNSPLSWAGYFAGDVNVTGNLSKGGGSFRIDHPLDPENKYLYHSFIESPDMMNVYNGNVTTDENSDAVVQLPDYFSALNKDFRYQLTVIGQFAQAIISEEINGNQFSIETDKPHVKVSWQVTGIRKDAYAEANRIQPEVDKLNREKGKYLHPEAFGLDESRGVDFERNAEAERKLERGEGK